jgi:hypothetical protein
MACDEGPRADDSEEDVHRHFQTVMPLALGSGRRRQRFPVRTTIAADAMHLGAAAETATATSVFGFHEAVWLAGEHHALTMHFACATSLPP